MKLADCKQHYAVKVIKNNVNPVGIASLILLSAFIFDWALSRYIIELHLVIINQ